MGIEVKILADSIGHHNRRITTFQLKYQRFFHSELMTHRVFSRNASSSRAIPVAKMIEMVERDPAMPIHWGRNQPGMQAKEELEGYAQAEVKEFWYRARDAAVHYAKLMNGLNAHKQIVNRILEPFQWISVVLTATEYDNWFALRDHADAQPEIQDLAHKMRLEYDASKPKVLKVGEWHVPYVSEDEIHEIIDSGASWFDLAKISSARCCRVSYLKHDGGKPSIREDLDLFERLAGSFPPHMSPLEHCAMCVDEDKFFFNIRGFKSYRYFYETHEVHNLKAR